MERPLNRRTVLGLGVGAAAAAASGLIATPAQAEEAGADVTAAESAVAACDSIAWSYQRHSGRAGGKWNAHISTVSPDGTRHLAVSHGSDEVLQALSVNKVPVAVAVLDKVDRGLISLDQQVEVSAAIIIPDGDGMFRLDGAYPSMVTVGHALAALLTISDDTAVRLSGLVAPALEINEILVAKGFPNTQVEPVANPNRFYLGTSTPREMHDLFNALVAGELLSAGSTEYLLNLLRSPIAFTDGVRRNMSSDERARVATKAGWLNDERHEAGIMFDSAGAPVLTYSLFASGQGQPGNYGATHPAVEARARMGRDFFDGIVELPGVRAETFPIPEYEPSNGG
ncbi:beta-lactamase class A [Stackebrandtia albiflava]|uniref:Beta-lactamase n=1 Tax=Stackebrandtia albiflava TaxID=406432 RepID=A0A562V9Q8_9ACTN|nr:serine hydrolase [Stackebrandtia albiflava]TWJ14614.1 beta-lactamase class A [Stackebrandtia albiflava]